MLSALLTATVSTTNVLLKDRLDRRLLANQRKGLQQELYRRYADPLTSAAESLYWRLNEIFEVGGGYYLKAGGGDVRFERYKVDSTHYRIAVLLGWMAALRRELVLNAAQPDGSVGAMRDAMGAVTRALAEGEHVERAMVRDLSALWGLPAPQDTRTGRELHGTMKRFLHAEGVASVAELEDPAPDELVGELAGVLEQHSATVVDRELVERSAGAAMQALAVREAWIFRDWQDAIGEWMLVPSSAARRFDVKGFRAFMASSPDAPDDRQWRERLQDLTDDLDVDALASTDARVAQLGEVYLAVSQLLIRFHAEEPRRSSVEKGTLRAARGTVEQRASQEPPKRYRPWPVGRPVGLSPTPPHGRRPPDDGEAALSAVTTAWTCHGRRVMLPIVVLLLMRMRPAATASACSGAKARA